MTRRLTDIALAAVVVGAMFLAGALWLRSRDKRIEKAAVAKQEVKALDSARASQSDTLRARERIVYRDRTQYVAVRDRNIAANPDNVPLIETVTAADRALASDSARRVADSTLRATQEREIDRLKAMKAVSLPRFSAYMAAGEIFTDLEKPAPAARIGAELRLFAPLSVEAYIQAKKRTVPSPDSSRVEISAAVWGKLTIR